MFIDALKGLSTDFDSDQCQIDVFGMPESDEFSALENIRKCL